jgi:hypothetical protein
MISVSILALVLIAQLVTAAYTLDKINTNDTFDGYEKADVSKKLTLGNTVLAVSFFTFILIMYAFKWINYMRTELLLIFSVLVSGIIFIVSQHFLYLQRKANPNYETKKTELENVLIDVNKTEFDIQYIVGIASLAIAGVITSVLLGKYILAEEKIVKVSQPVYMTPAKQESKQIDNREPDYLSDISKNFII